MRRTAATCGRKPTTASSTDIFAIQDEIANAIVTALRGSLAANQAKAVVQVQADTENMEAYELYLKARELFIARKRSGRKRAPVRDRPWSWTRSSRAAGRAWRRSSAVAESWGFHDRDFNTLADKSARRALELDAELVDALGRVVHGQVADAADRLGSGPATQRQGDRYRCQERNSLSVASHQPGQPGFFRARPRRPGSMHRN